MTVCLASDRSAGDTEARVWHPLSGLTTATRTSYVTSLQITCRKECDQWTKLTLRKRLYFISPSLHGIVSSRKYWCKVSGEGGHSAEIFWLSPMRNWGGRQGYTHYILEQNVGSLLLCIGRWIRYHIFYRLTPGLFFGALHVTARDG